MYYLKRKKSLFVFSTELYLPLYSSCSFVVFCSGILSFPYSFKISFPYLCGIYFLTPISTRMYMDFMNRKKELENELFSTTHWISLNSSTDQYFDCLTPKQISCRYGEPWIHFINGSISNLFTDFLDESMVT